MQYRSNKLSQTGCLQLALLLGAQELAQDVASADQVVELGGREVSLADEALQPLELFLGVARVCAGLLEDLDVVLSVLILECLSELGRLVDTVGICALELFDNGVEGLDGAAGNVKTTTNSTVGAGVGVQEVDEVLLGAGAIVWGGLGAALLEVLDGGVGLNALLGCKGFGVLGFGVDLSDQDIGLVDEGVGKRLPDGGESLAVYILSAMGWVENVEITYVRTTGR
jgi:hypothetical protein